RGKFIASGVSGFVELTNTGTIVKTPNTGPEYEECRHELFLEAEIYRILGPHPRLIRVLDWDAQREVLTLEYMRRGTLKDFLASLPPHESTRSNYDDQISREQRLRWAVQCAEGLELLHSHGVWHCDFKPKNILLDHEGGIRIVDFGGSSLHNSTPSAHPGSRFAPPSKALEWGLRQDLFSLGSMIYTIMTGAEPYADRGSEEVVELFERQYFPTTTHLLGGEIMRDCWLARVTSA
ncbi:kinase-like domain-containing protein, partial [Neohortaea acidophila]